MAEPTPAGPRPSEPHGALPRRALITGAPLGLAAFALAACSPREGASSDSAPPAAPSGTSADGTPVPDMSTDVFTVTEHGRFAEPWALAFLPGTSLLLVSERGGALRLRDQGTGEVRDVADVPEVHHRGQAGLHDVVAAPSYAEDGRVHLSWVRRDARGSHGVVGRARLDVDAPALRDLEVLWEQDPASGDGHYSLRLLPHEGHLYVTSGDRQEFTPAQDMAVDQGVVLRLTPDGAPADGNPWAGEGSPADMFWTIGHRNPLGIAADSRGQVWVAEMGPAGGDELDLLVAGANYGWPEASNGSHYDGADIPDHAPGDGFQAPAAFWTPSISPGSLAVHTGTLFEGWRDSALIAALSGQALVRVTLDGDVAREADRWDLGTRIRAVREAPDGAVWLAEDGDGGRLLQLRPA